MKKSYPDISVDIPAKVSEPAALYGGCSMDSSERVASVSAREQVLAKTVSVDKYFDELISQVHYDYASVRYTPKPEGCCRTIASGCMSIILKIAL